MLAATPTRSDGTPVAKIRLLVSLLWMAAIVVILAGLSACGGGGSTPSTSAGIGPAGGTVTGPDGVQVVVPAGALLQVTTLSINRSSAGAPGNLPEDNPAGPVYEFLPHGLVFNKPVTIRMPVPAGSTGNGVFMASPGEDWQIGDATVTGGVAEWQRNSFSWGMIPLACAPSNSAPYSAGNPDPYPCTYPRGAASASATPGSVITRQAYGSPFGSAGSWIVNQAGTVRLTINFEAAPDCQASGTSAPSGRVKLLQWDPTVPLSTPNRVRTLDDRVVALTLQPITIPAGIFATGTGTYSRGVGSAFFDVSFSHLVNTGTQAFGYSFSCNRPSRPVHSGGDLLTFISAVPVPTVTYTVGGTVSGLTGAGLVLQNNAGDNLSVAADGAFNFSTPVGSGAAYAVTVQAQPSGQLCMVQNGAGTAGANVSSVAVSCVPAYAIGGMVSGLSGTGLTLQNNLGNNLSVSANGAFAFATPIASGGAYSVSVLTQPSGQTCTVQNASGTVTATVSNIAVSCPSSGGLALVANSGVTNGVNGLSVYRVNAATGALSFLNNANAGNTPWAIAIAPNGLSAYVSNAMGGTLSSYSIDSANGVLSPISSTSSNNVFSIAMDRLGRFLWTANYGYHTVSAFSIGFNGALTAVGAPLATSSSLPYAITAHPTMDFIYVAHQSSNNAVTVYSVNATTGALTLRQTLTNVITSSSGIVIDPSGRFAYASSLGGGVSAFSINQTTGLLTYIGAASISGAVHAIAVHPNGQYVYVTADNTSNNVQVLAINPGTGALTAAGSPFSAGQNPRGVTVNAAGTLLYVTNYVSNDVSVFSITGSGATLTSLGTTAATGSQPVGIALAP
jgi:6-phosphogluconolactonase (cycloisomerase 2 family)